MNVIFVKRPLFKEVTYLSTRGNIQEKSHKEEIKEEERVVDQSAIQNYTANNVNQEIKEEVKELDEEQVVKESNLATDHFVHYNEYVQVEMYLTKQNLKTINMSRYLLENN